VEVVKWFLMLASAAAAFIAGAAGAVDVNARSGPSHDRGRPHVDPAAHHSLREPVTDQNFYFVMADRFDNGDTANDNGGRSG
jgi:hypothetical protein